MPCHDPDPSDRQRRSRRVCQLLQYLLTAMGRPVSREIISAAHSRIGDVDNLDKNTALLCELIAGLVPAQLDRFVYDGRNASARRLADWWENHMSDDKRRLAEEERLQRVLALRRLALSKLTSEEIEALGVVGILTR